MIRRLPRAWVAVDASIDDHPKLAALGCWAAEAFKQLIIISKKSGLRGHLSPHSRTGAAVCLSMRKPLGLFICEGDPTMRTAGMRFWSLEALYEKGVADLLAAGHLQRCLCSQGCVSIRDWDEWQRDPERAERAREWREEPNAANENERGERKRTRRTKTNERSPSPSPSLRAVDLALEKISGTPAAADAAVGPSLSLVSDTPDASPSAPPTASPASAGTPVGIPVGTPSASSESAASQRSPRPSSPSAPAQNAARGDAEHRHRAAFLWERYEVYASAYRHKKRRDPAPDVKGEGRTAIGRVRDVWGDTITALDSALVAYVSETDPFYVERDHALSLFSTWVKQGRHRRVSAAATPHLNPAEIIACPTPGCGQRTMRQNFVAGTCPDCWLAKRDRRPTARTA